jgi:aquaporin Z
MTESVRDRIGMRHYVAEAIGTFFLVLIGPGSSMVNAASGGVIGHMGVALSFGFVVTAMIHALGHLSGAHINPAVTIAFWSARRFPAAAVLPYVIAQSLGAIAAALALRGVLGSVVAAGATLPASALGITVGSAFAIEWLLSFVLMLVIMAVATDERVASGFAAIAVGVTVAFCAMTGGPLTGASMNPARSLGPALAGQQWTAHWLYWIAPIAGTIAAARVYEWLRHATARPACDQQCAGR